MKKLKIIFFSLLAMPILGGQNAAEAQNIAKETEVVDLGEVAFEHPVTAVFNLTNRGSDFMIKEVETYCECSQVSYPRKRIQKGESFTVSVTYDATMLGHFEKEIALISDQFDIPYYLTFRGVVKNGVASRPSIMIANDMKYSIAGVKLDRRIVEFPDSHIGDVVEEKVTFVNNSKEKIRPRVLQAPSYLRTKVTPEVVEPGNAGVITFTLNSANLRHYGLYQSSVYLMMNPNESVARSNEMVVSAVIIPRFNNLSESQMSNAPSIVISETELDFTKSGGNSKANREITIKNVGKSTLNILRLQPNTEGITVDLRNQTIEPGESVKMKIAFKRKQLKTSKVQPRILMITNDPYNPKLEITINVE